MIQKYKYFFLSLFFLGIACSITKKHKNDMIDLNPDCLVNLKNEVKEKWHKSQIDGWDKPSCYIRNDSFIYNVQNIYQPCLLGFAQDSIIEIFGATKHIGRQNYKGQITGDVSYHCIQASAPSTESMMKLIFHFKSDTLFKISYQSPTNID